MVVSAFEHYSQMHQILNVLSPSEAFALSNGAQFCNKFSMSSIFELAKIAIESMPALNKILALWPFKQLNRHKSINSRWTPNSNRSWNCPINSSKFCQPSLLQKAVTCKIEDFGSTTESTWNQNNFSQILLSRIQTRRPTLIRTLKKIKFVVIFGEFLKEIQPAIYRLLEAN